MTVCEVSSLAVQMVHLFSGLRVVGVVQVAVCWLSGLFGPNQAAHGRGSDWRPFRRGFLKKQQCESFGFKRSNRLTQTLKRKELFDDASFDGGLMLNHHQQLAKESSSATSFRSCF